MTTLPPSLRVKTTNPGRAGVLNQRLEQVTRLNPLVYQLIWILAVHSLPHKARMGVERTRADVRQYKFNPLYSFAFVDDHLTDSSIPLPIGSSVVFISGTEATKARYFLASSRTTAGSIMLSAAMIPSSASFG
jgi:hypothetical protein